MRIITQSAIDISESLAAYMFASYIHQKKDLNVTLEKRLNYVYTGEFSRADIYLRQTDMAVEVKSVAHGNDALKGVIQASMYKEETDDAAFCIQRPHRKSLRETLEGMCGSYGVGLVYINGIPDICSKDNIEEATGGCSKPFEIWKDATFASTRERIIANGRSGWTAEYIATLDQFIDEYSDDIFKFKVEPDTTKPGLSGMHGHEDTSVEVSEFYASD